MAGPDSEFATVPLAVPDIDILYNVGEEDLGYSPHRQEFIIYYQLLIATNCMFLVSGDSCFNEVYQKQEYRKSKELFKALLDIITLIIIID